MYHYLRCLDHLCRQVTVGSLGVQEDAPLLVMVTHWGTDLLHWCHRATRAITRLRGYIHIELNN